jgi:phosphoribosylanthranilate isomerase
MIEALFQSEYAKIRTMIKVKICGITNIKDAQAAVDMGADALGFVFYKKSPRAITPEKAQTIISNIPPFMKTVGVFVNEHPATIEKISTFAGLDIIQLHGSEHPEACCFPQKMIKAIQVRGLTDLEQLMNYKSISAFLLDTFSPDTFGGTGQVFNWDIALEAKKIGRIILAGGLNPDNIEEAINKVKPYAVDVSSGVEGSTKGKKDLLKLKLFIEKAKKNL